MTKTGVVHTIVEDNWRTILENGRWWTRTEPTELLWRSCRRGHYLEIARCWSTVNTSSFSQPTFEKASAVHTYMNIHGQGPMPSSSKSMKSIAGTRIDYKIFKNERRPVGFKKSSNAAKNFAKEILLPYWFVVSKVQCFRNSKITGKFICTAIAPLPSAFLPRSDGSITLTSILSIAICMWILRMTHDSKWSNVKRITKALFVLYHRKMRIILHVVMHSPTGCQTKWKHGRKAVCTRRSSRNGK